MANAGNAAVPVFQLNQVAVQNAGVVENNQIHGVAVGVVPPAVFLQPNNQIQAAVVENNQILVGVVPPAIFPHPNNQIQAAVVENNQIQGGIVGVVPLAVPPAVFPQPVILPHHGQFGVNRFAPPYVCYSIDPKGEKCMKNISKLNGFKLHVRKVHGKNQFECRFPSAGDLEDHRVADNC